jgi:predicted transcriptional regulator
MNKDELKPACLIKINEKINKDIYPGKYNKMLTHFWHVAFTYPDVFINSHLAIYTYFTFWSNGTEIKTDNKIIATYGLCSETTAKMVIKDLMLFGLIERIKKGNGLSRKRSIYRIVGVQEGKIIRKQNEKQIIELIKKKTNGKASPERRNPPPVQTESAPH